MSFVSSSSADSEYMMNFRPCMLGIGGVAGGGLFCKKSSAEFDVAVCGVEAVFDATLDASINSGVGIVGPDVEIRVRSPGG